MPSVVTYSGTTVAPTPSALTYYGYDTASTPSVVMTYYGTAPAFTPLSVITYYGTAAAFTPSVVLTYYGTNTASMPSATLTTGPKPITASYTGVTEKVTIGVGVVVGLAAVALVAVLLLKIIPRNKVRRDFKDEALVGGGKKDWIEE